MTATLSRSDGSIGTNVSSQLSQVEKQAKAMFATQRELLDATEQMNERWFARAKSEAELASKLAAARSVPDLTSVCQEWISQQMQQYVEDSNHVMADVQKFIHTGARLMQNGRADAS
jgi:hypothetical protein